MLIEILRTYGGQEGVRVRAGRRFWVSQPGSGKKPADVDTMSPARFRQLQTQGLAGPVVGAAQGKAAPAPKAKVERPLRDTGTLTPRAKVEPDSTAPRPADPRAPFKAQSPKTPRPEASRPGGLPGEKASTVSSSQAALPTGGSTLKQRGVRRGDKKPAGSPSTTPISSSPGQGSSTDPTPPGGGTTAGSEDSAAFA